MDAQIVMQKLTAALLLGRDLESHATEATGTRAERQNYDTLSDYVCAQMDVLALGEVGWQAFQLGRDLESHAHEASGTHVQQRNWDCVCEWVSAELASLIEVAFSA